MRASKKKSKPMLPLIPPLRKLKKQQKRPLKLRLKLSNKLETIKQLRPPRARPTPRL